MAQPLPRDDVDVLDDVRACLARRHPALTFTEAELERFLKSLPWPPALHQRHPADLAKAFVESLWAAADRRALPLGGRRHPDS